MILFIHSILVVEFICALKDFLLVYNEPPIVAIIPIKLSTAAMGGPLKISLRVLE